MSRLMLISPAFWYFLAGLASSASLNLLTSIPGNKEEASSYFVAAVPWLLVAASLAVAASCVESARRESDRLTPDTLSSVERAAIEKAILKRSVRTFSWAATLSLAFVIVGVVVILAVFR
ncbi:hypothetical protein [Actinoplanes sp. NPDC051851]|uniref:hypothetical protein n=1 Tax=Actinoplanes sp. NPDC051851 TaxID=3154753 RepID=UPI00344124F6